MNKIELKGQFQCGVKIGKESMDNLIDSSIGILNDVSELPEMDKNTLGTEYKIGNSFYKCVFENDAYRWEVTSGGLPVDNYNNLKSKPKINGIDIEGSKLASDYKLLKNDGSYQAVKPQNTDVVYIVRDGKAHVAKVSDLIKSGAEHDVVFLVGIFDTEPSLSGLIIGESKYFNSTTKLIYTADSANTWEAQGMVPVVDVLYIDNSTNTAYRFDDNMIAVGGGAGGGSCVLYTSQSLTEPQKAQARENIDAISVEDVADKVENCTFETENAQMNDYVLVQKNGKIRRMLLDSFKNLMG